MELRMKYNSKDMIFLPAASTFLPRVHFITVLREEILKKEGRKKKKKKTHIFWQGAISQGKPWILTEGKEARIWQRDFMNSNNLVRNTWISSPFCIRIWYPDEGNFPRIFLRLLVVKFQIDDRGLMYKHSQ